MNQLLEDVEKLFGHPKAAAPDEKDAGSPAPPVAQASAAVPSDTSETPNRTLLIHGYSADGAEFQSWKSALVNAHVDTATIEIGNYISLNNEITIKDLGEAFDRALRLTKWSAGSKDDKWTFNAIVHSTGMLVLRQWLISDPFAPDNPRSRVRRLKHLIGLAPATFGSPQGKKGRSWLGALVKGNRTIGPDFMNAGDMVLDGLELGSQYTWDLAMADMLGEKPLFGKAPDTPYVAVFIGNVGYSGVAALANSPGSDGTVRWAGCALNTRMVQLDFRREPKLLDASNAPTRVKISDWVTGRLDCPVIAVDGRNHGTILSDPDSDAVTRVSDFLRNVKTQDSYDAWLKAALAHADPALKKMDGASGKDDGGNIDGQGGSGWQQFVMHVKDDHGDGVPDYNVQLFVGDDLAQSDEPAFKGVPLSVDTYSGDSSYRCFYVRLSDDMLKVGTAGHPRKVWMELLASSGTLYIEYEAYTGDAEPTRLTPILNATNAVKLDLSDLGSDAKLFFPYTTTLVEIVLEREPTPLSDVSSLFKFLTT